MQTTNMAAGTGPSGLPGEAPPVRLWWPFVAIALAWAIFIGATLTHLAYLLDHHDWLARPGVTPWAIVAIFLGSWYLMLAAMMLPCIISQLHHMKRRGGRTRQTQIAFLGAYLTIWTAFGLLALAGDTALFWLLLHWDLLALHPWLIGIGLLLVAGIYQFTPFKYQALQACQLCELPEQGLRADQAWQHGWRIGTASLRAAWPLMLIMFGVGMTNILWLAALTVLMVLEHLAVAAQRRLVTFSGIVIIMVSLLWLAQATSPDTALAATTDGFAQSQAITDGTVALHIEPARYGANTLQAVVNDAQGQPLAEAQLVAEIQMLDMDMGTQDIPLSASDAAQPGNYAGQAIFSMPGRWQLTLLLTLPGAGTTQHVVYRFRVASPATP